MKVSLARCFWLVLLVVSQNNNDGLVLGMEENSTNLSLKNKTQDLSSSSSSSSSSENPSTKNVVEESASIRGSQQKQHDLEHFGLKPPTTPIKNAFHQGRIRTCGTPEPTRERILHSNSIVQDYVENRKRRRTQGVTTLVVPTCFHVIRPEADTNDQFLNAEKLQLQLDGINEGFSSSSCCDTNLSWCDGECSVETGVRFAMATVDANGDIASSPAPADNTVDSTSAPGACITRTYNNDWYFSSPITDSALDNEMRFNLRRGDATVANIYFKDGGGTLLGIAQFPSSYATQSYTDGVVVDDSYVIGAGDASFGEGDTLTHELGHWMGLYHTFQDGCEGGDMIGDTPPEKEPATGCAVGRDTCPDFFGLDPVHNFMDYSNDNCLFEFTQNQANRMFAEFELYRIGRQHISLQDDVMSVPTDMVQHELQIYVLAVESGSRVECISDALDATGDVDIYMRDGIEPDISTNNFDCRSESYTNSESCSLLSQTGIVYTSVYAFRGTGGVVLTCTGAEVDTTFELSSGVPSGPFNLPANGSELFSLQIANPNARVVCLMDSPNNDATTIFLRFDQPPDPNTSDYDCSASGSDRCTVLNPGSAQVLWAMAISSAAVTGLYVTCHVSIPRALIGISPDTSSPLISLGSYEAQTFNLVAPPLSAVSCSATTTAGDGNMFLRWGDEPDLTSATYDCFVFGLTRPCTVADLYLYGETPNLYITIESLANGLNDVVLNCAVSFPSIPLQNGVATEPFEIPNVWQIFATEIGRGDIVSCSLTSDNAGTDTVNLFLDFETPLSQLESGCSSLSDTGNEECTVENLNSYSILYVVVGAMAVNPTGIVLICTITPPEVVEIGEAIPLSNGISSDPISLQESEFEVFTLAVQPGARTTCETTGSNGDADLYVRHNEEADLSSYVYDCASESDGSSVESCRVRDMGIGEDGVLWITVRAWAAFSDLTVTCRSHDLGPPLMLDDGIASGPYTLLANEQLSFFFPVEGDETVTCVTSSGTVGDTDLYLQFNNEVDRSNIADISCISEDLSSEEVCEVTVPPFGVSVLWGALYGFSATSEVFVMCGSEHLPLMVPIPLESGAPSDPISLSTGMIQTYTFAVIPPTSVTCMIEATSPLNPGDADLFLRASEEPDLLNLVYDCGSQDTASAESCTLDIPEGISTMWASIYAFEAFEDVFITCTSDDSLSVIRLVDGQPSNPLSLPALATRTYQLFVPEGPNVICATDHLVEDASADADLYVGINEVPDLDTHEYDCSSITLTSEEECILSDLPPDTTLFVTILAYGEFSNLILTCSSYSDTSVSVSQLSDGIGSEPIQLNANQVQDFTFDTTSDTTCTLEGLNGDADLYLRWNAPPVLIDRPAYDCASVSATSSESCSVVNPGDASVLWARIFAYESFRDVVLTCFEEAVVPPTSAPPLPGCSFDDAIPLEYDDVRPDGLIVTGSTTGATANMPDVTGCSTNVGSPAVFYKFTATSQATIALTTCSENTNFDTVLAVYRDVSQVACSVVCEDSNDDYGLGTSGEACLSSALHSIVIIDTLPSTNTYYIAVSGYDINAAGTFQLLIEELSE